MYNMYEKKYGTIFIAVPILKQISAFTNIQSYYEMKLQPLVYFSAAKELHITIAYIGRIDVDIMHVVQTAMCKAIEQYKNTHVMHDVHLIWNHKVTLFNNAVSLLFVRNESFISLAQDIRNALKEASISYDDRFDFEPHLTIGRIRPASVLKDIALKKAVITSLEPSELVLQDILIDCIGIYESGKAEPVNLFSLS